MKQSFFKVNTLALAAGLLVACTPEPQAVNEATLEAVEVRGISFNDPLPVDDADADAVLETDTLALAELTDEAEAEIFPMDIAAIPSATPVPTPEPSEEPAPSDVAESSHQVDDSAEVAAAAPPSSPGEFIPLSFDVLSGYKYEEPLPNEGDKPEDVEARRKKDQIPDTIKALNGQKAVVEGWMVPMEVADDGSVRSFVLVKTQPQCCFGDMQAMNEWVDVMMTGENAEFNVDMPMKVFGELEVGEKMEDGFVLSIYRMKAERVEL